MTPVDSQVLNPGSSRWGRSGAVVSQLVVALLVVVAIVGAVAGNIVVSMLCGLVLALVLLSRLWARLAFAEVDYHCQPAGERLMAGDVIELTLTIENRKPLPLPWLSLSETIPAGLQIIRQAGAAAGLLRDDEIRETTSLGQYERVRFHHRLRATRRGHYGFGPTRLASSDIFGFYEARLDTPKRPPRLVVYPRVVALPDFEFNSSRPIGDSWTAARRNEDPTRPNGLREYRPGDSTRRIDWKATARRDALFVRTYDPSVSQRVVILLECDTSAMVWRFHSQVLEAAVTGAASVAARAIELGHGVGLVCNGNMASALAAPVLAPGAGPGQLGELMTTLAGVGSLTTGPLERLAARFGPEAMPQGASVVYVAGIFRPSSVDYVAELARRGHPTVALYVGAEEPPEIAGLAIEDCRALFAAAGDGDV